MELSARISNDAKTTTGSQGTPSPGEHALRAAAEQFESIFVQTLMKSMRQTVPTSEFTESGEIDTYREMLDEAMAKRIGGGGGLGIAEMVTKQYLPYVNGEGPPDTRETPGMAPLPASRGGRTSPAEMRALPPRGAGRPPTEISRALAAYAGTDGTMRSLGTRAAGLGGAAADTVRLWGGQIEDAARENDLPPELLVAVIVQESSGRPEAVSSRGATGLMQLMPETAREVGVDDPTDPAQNIAGGARYLAHLKDRFDGDLDLVLAAYNAGPGNVRRHGNTVPPFPETRDYVTKVRAMYGDLEGTETLDFASDRAERKETGR